MSDWWYVGAVRVPPLIGGMYTYMTMISGENSIMWYACYVEDRHWRSGLGAITLASQKKQAIGL